MQRILILGAFLVAVGGMGVTRVRGIEGQLKELERIRREVPENARAVQADLARLESELEGLRAELAQAHRQERIDPQEIGVLGERIEALGEEIGTSLAALSAQEARIDDLASVDWTPDQFETRLEELESGVESRWDGLSQTVSATATMAERTRNELGALNAGLMAPASEEVRWREMVGPTVQLAGEATVGSGVLLESQPEVGKQDSFETLLLTSWHVVRDIRADSLQEDPPIPVAVYLEAGGVRNETAELLAHDAELDIALLRLNSVEVMPRGAILPLREELERMRIFRDVYAVGCPLGNDPIPTRGELADTDHYVDGNTYWMISAPTYIGNSGGGIYDGQSHALLGIFSKIYTHGSLRPTVVPHMGLVTPMDQVYTWLESNGYAELVPGDRGFHLKVAEVLRR